LRRARKAPGFSLAAITTLALGIGAAAATLVLTVSVRPIPRADDVLESLLFEVPAADWISIAAASVGFGVIALVACVLPALRAAGADLVSALHHE
jgi:hypothetical protein